MHILLTKVSDILFISTNIDHYNHGPQSQERRRWGTTSAGVEEIFYRWLLLYFQLPAGLDLGSGSYHYLVLCVRHYVWSNGLQDHFRYSISSLSVSCGVENDILRVNLLMQEVDQWTTKWDWFDQSSCNNCIHFGVIKREISKQYMSKLEKLCLIT